MEPQLKKIKTDSFLSLAGPTCKHIVKRKKRFCKMTVAKGQEYCGEHMPATTNDVNDTEPKSVGGDRKRRIQCPLDPKHTVYAWNLAKHLKICNAQIKDLPSHIVPGINEGDAESIDDYSSLKLGDLDPDLLHKIIDKLNKLYANHIEGTIKKRILNHDVMKTELENPLYGPESLKHLTQTSSLLGYLKEFNFLNDNTSYVEFGAGKGQVSYWLAQIIKDMNMINSTVLLVDKASHRHKKDNKIENRNTVQRIRADISDLNLNKLEIVQKSKQLIGVSKHLCGAATDLALRCILNGNETIKTRGFLIALCCHHRCSWKSFVGKKFFLDNEITQKEFSIITKMVGWAICGTGMSRERRKALEEKEENYEDNVDDIVEKMNNQSDIKLKLSREKKEEIGMKCKRIIDYARLCYLKENNYDTSMYYYIESSTTLENCCFVSKLLE